MTPTTKRALAALAAIVTGIAAFGALRARRRPVDPALAAERERVAHAEGISDPSVSGAWFAAAYAHGRTNEIVVGNLRDPRATRAVHTTIETPQAPVVSPDGARIMVRDQRTGVRVVHVIDAASGRPEATIEAGAGERIEAAHWSPDGKTIAYARRDTARREPTELHAFEVETRTDRLVATSSALALTWSPDGEQIAFRQGSRLYEVAASGGKPAGLKALPHVHGCLAWSPDGRTIAYCVRDDDAGCDRLALHDVAGSGNRRVDAVRCASRIAWAPSSDAIAFWAPGQPLSVVHVAKGDVRPIGPADENVGAIALLDTGAALWASSAPAYPLTFWLSAPDGSRAPVLEPFRVDARWSAPPERLAGEGAPIDRYPRTCGERDAPGPALVWLPCSGVEPMAPWLQETAYLALHGVTTFIVHVPSGPRDGPEVLVGKKREVAAALESIERRPDVTPDALFLFSCCGASPLGYETLATHASRLAGFVDLNGAPGPWVEQSLGSVPAAPPILWATFGHDDTAGPRSELARRLVGRGFAIDEHVYDTNHTYQQLVPRARLLADLASFIRSRSRYSCE